jgi:hypothetical protein
MHIRKPEIPTRMPERKLRMIEPRQVQDRCIKIMHVHLILRNLIPISSEASYRIPGFAPPPAIHEEYTDT